MNALLTTIRKTASIIPLVAFLAITGNSFSQLQVTPSTNATHLAQTLAGPGVTISGATINCPSPANNAAGIFVGAASNIGITSGVLLTSGSVANAIGPNSQTGIFAVNQSTYNDSDITAIEPLAINDVCILEFNAVPTCSLVSFTYAFGSDEYPEYVGKGYNDVFGIFVTGTNPSGPAYKGYNMALIPSTTTAVSIDSVNNGDICPTAGPCVNCAYYIDNCTFDPGSTIEYDGFTKPITVTLDVVPCGTYHFKLAIADAGDDGVDSGVFFESQSLVCATSLTVTATTTSTTCGGNIGTATVNNVAGGQAPYTYSWNTSPLQTTQTATGLDAGTYTVTVTDANGCLQGIQIVTVALDSSSIPVANVNNANICSGETALLTASGGGIYFWNTGASTSSISVSPGTNTTYTVLVSVGSCTATAVAVVAVQAVPVASVQSTTDPGGSTTLTATGGGTYTWVPPTGLSNPNISNPVVSPLQTTRYCVYVTNAAGCTDSACVTVEYKCKDIFVPTAFSPNNDGVNEMQCVLGDCFSNFQFSIYDRWGERVFETDDPKICWNGMYKGSLMNTGVFVYYLKATLFNGEEVFKKGNVSLIR